MHMEVELIVAELSNGFIISSLDGLIKIANQHLICFNAHSTSPSKAQCFTISWDADPAGHALLLAKLRELLPSQDCMVNRLEMRGDNLSLRGCLEDTPDIFFTHDD
ncbi:hypothetical protein D3C75_1010750 [compost metagenome]